MASYLSYFTSSSNGPASSAPGGQQLSTATWTSSFSSRIAGLRKALTKDSEEDDPDNEDCSHVSNVLRAYYTEKGQSFPEWLPPDPKKPVAPPPQVQASYGQYGNAYGAGYGGQNQHARGSSGGRGGGLSDLWDSGPSQISTPPPPQSLRAARPTPQSLRSGDLSRSGSSNSSQAATNATHASNARPLPSQRAGSYQTSNPVANQGGALGSRDRLRARLQGGGSGRSSPSAGLNNGGQPSYNSALGSGGGTDRSQSSQPYISASEPWATSGDPYGYGAGYNDGGLSHQQHSNPNYRHRPGGPR